MDREGMAIREGELPGKRMKGESFEQVCQSGLAVRQTVGREIPEN